LSVANSTTIVGQEPWQNEQPAAVYRLYDAADQLLYIGSSHQPGVRQQEHRKKPWGAEIDRREDRWYRNRAVAYAEESAAIRAERPKYNIIANPAAQSRSLGAEVDEFEEVQRVLDALDDVERIADPEARSRGQAQIMALIRERSASWNAERTGLAQQMQAGGESVRGIARRLGIKPGTVQDLLRGYKGSGRNRPRAE
jgi:predicted GIY-YIG superfamily endonuclease